MTARRSQAARIATAGLLLVLACSSCTFEGDCTDNVCFDDHAVAIRVLDPGGRLPGGTYRIVVTVNGQVESHECAVAMDGTVGSCTDAATDAFITVRTNTAEGAPSIDEVHVDITRDGAPQASRTFEPTYGTEKTCGQDCASEAIEIFRVE